MARELRRRGVTHVVMEASGVYTDPVYYALCEQDFTEVAVINPAHAKALKGHKTDLGLRAIGGAVRVRAAAPLPHSAPISWYSSIRSPSHRLRDPITNLRRSALMPQTPS
jgi:transposase